MKISIIIPVYNVENYILQCLNSVSNLNIDYEIIIVNDGSTDKSIELINDFTKHCEVPIKVISKKNGGLSSARNCGIDNAEGNYLFFLDSDDFIDKYIFESFAKDVINDRPDIGFANYRYLKNGKIEENTETKHRKKAAKKINGLIDGLSYGDLVFDRTTNFINTEACFLLINKHFLNSHSLKFTEGIYHEDSLFTITCMIFAQHVKYYDYPFYIYRMRDDSIMHTTRPEVIKKKLLDKAYLSNELFKFKEKYQISKTFIDSQIVDNLLVSNIHFKIKSENTRRILSSCHKLTLRSRIRIILYKALSISYKSDVGNI